MPKITRVEIVNLRNYQNHNSEFTKVCQNQNGDNGLSLAEKNELQQSYTLKNDNYRLLEKEKCILRVIISLLTLFRA